MGNSATKEQRPSPPQLRPGHVRQSSIPTRSNTGSTTQTFVEHSPTLVYNPQQGRGSRADLTTLLGFGGSGERESSGIETRRETKQEREARKLEKERVLREKERERSMREESVDGGYLVTQGVYTGYEDFNKVIVRQLMIERRIAPFWNGLNDHSDSWTENQLIAATRGLPIPAPDEVPSEDYFQSLRKTKSQMKIAEQNLQSLTIAISSRSQSYTSDTSSVLSPSHQTSTIPSNSLPAATSAGSTLFRGRAKTLASLTTSSKNNTQADMTPREINLPKDPFVNGQPIEAYLYKDASECPICFLYYPPYLNKTRCCDQAICSECFVQIKRADPHPPEHVDPANPPPPTLVENSDAEGAYVEGALVSEPAACPFCKQPEFGITFDPPSFRRGLTYINHALTHPLANATSAMSSSSSLASYSGSGSQLSSTMVPRRRTTSISASSSMVITTDRVRPDWAIKLSTARAHAARRSAAATALHTAAYLMGNRNQSPDARNFGPFGRRGMLRRSTGTESPLGGTSSTHLNVLALMSERYAASSGARPEPGGYGEVSPSIEAPPRTSSRRNRMEDLEDMMMMEAIRLSLASEEERRKREDKEKKKEAKKKEKELKKADKTARKAGIYQGTSLQSSQNLDIGCSGGTQLLDFTKGKAVERGSIETASSLKSDPSLSSLSIQSNSIHSANNEEAQNHPEKTRAQLQPGDGLPSSLPYGASTYKPSHLRNLSNASSFTSSIGESLSGSLKDGGSHSSFEPSLSGSGLNIPRAETMRDNIRSATPPGGGAGVEPMFNFRSLAAMIGHDEKSEFSGTSKHTENFDDSHHGHDRGESSSKAVADRMGNDS